VTGGRSHSALEPGSGAHHAMRGLCRAFATVAELVKSGPPRSASVYSVSDESGLYAAGAAATPGGRPPRGPPVVRANVLGASPESITSNRKNPLSTAIG